MTEDQEKSMRAQISDYSHHELVDLAIRLQNTIDANVAKIRGLEASHEQMSKQIPALTARNEELEDQVEHGASSDELEALRAKYNRLDAQYTELQEMNFALQKKLVG